MAEASAEEAAEAAEAARLVALLNALPASLWTLDTMELAADCKEDSEEAAPVWLPAAAALRLDKLLERAEVTEL